MNIWKICILCMQVLSMSCIYAAQNTPECQKKYETLLQNPPNLNELVFHTDCGLMNMMEIQKVSEIKYGSNTDFLDKVLRVANTHGISQGVAVDLGSGTGVWTKHLLSLKTWIVHAVDVFPESLKALAASTSEADKQRLVLQNEDFRDMHLPQNVDLIIANNSLCFVPRKDLDSVLDTVYHHLKPGGIFAATFWGKGDIRAKDHNLSTFSPEEVKKLLDGKYTIIQCCTSLDGEAENLDGKVVPWSVVYAIVQKPK